MQVILYIWRNLRRNKLRSFLTTLSIGFSLALMTVLHGYMAMQGEWGKEAQKHGRLVVMNSQGFSGRLPISYVDKVTGVAGIESATPYAWYGGNYKEEQMPFAQFGCDPKTVFSVWNEYGIDPAELANWCSTKNGCVVDRKLAEKRKWQVGEKIPLQGTFYPFNLDLVLCGVFDSPKYTDSLWFHWDYLNEGLKQQNARGVDNAGTIFAKTARAADLSALAKTIDDRFASSDNPTRTQTEAAFAQMFSDMLGNVQQYIRNIGLAVAFSLTLVAANAMAMSMRERTTEVAVLKAIGFSQLRVLVLVLGEACGITLWGGTLGILLGCSCLQALHNFNSQFFPFGVLEMAGPWLVWLVGISATIGLASGIVPAIRAAQLSVIDGLRRVI
ncbi:MAG: ABC transporter permease [Planctomycetes bacterium]|nr:ABC transporter permease [Planctomycetota bacterium]